MELTQRMLRRLRLRVAQPKYPIDTALVQAAVAADGAGADIYGSIRNPAMHLVYRYLTQFAAPVLTAYADRPLKELRVLDWGGGKGYAAYFLQQLGAQVKLYETNAFPHRTLWHKLHLQAKTSNGPALPFEAKMFDAVIGFGVLEHVPYDYDALKEVNRVLKDDGLFFCFNLPNQTGYVHKVTRWRGVRYHDRLYTKRETKLLLRRAGFNFVGKPWFRQLLPKTHYHYPYPRLFERLDLIATNYTPLGYLAASIEFVARKQHTYTAVH